tara:strand:+ start:2603 stop:2902 length:300 start_codon:yes stop_codon:yes gene_type:complete
MKENSTLVGSPIKELPKQKSGGNKKLWDRNPEWKKWMDNTPKNEWTVLQTERADATSVPSMRNRAYVLNRSFTDYEFATRKVEGRKEGREWICLYGKRR